MINYSAPVRLSCITRDALYTYGRGRMSVFLLPTTDSAYLVMLALNDELQIITRRLIKSPAEIPVHVRRASCQNFCDDIQHWLTKGVFS